MQCQPLSDYGGNPLEPIDIETKVSLLYDEFVSRARGSAGCNLILGPILALSASRHIRHLVLRTDIKCRV
jgi:hypothetical protein